MGCLQHEVYKASIPYFGQTLESETTPHCLPSFPRPPSILPLRSPSEGLLTELSLRINCHSPRRQAFITLILPLSPRRCGAWTTTAYVSTEQHLELPQRERQWQRASRRRPTALETQEKRQRQKHAHHWQQFTRAQFQVVDSRQNLYANQSN